MMSTGVGVWKRARRSYDYDEHTAVRFVFSLFLQQPRYLNTTPGHGTRSARFQMGSLNSEIQAMLLSITSRPPSVMLLVASNFVGLAGPRGLIVYFEAVRLAVSQDPGQTGRTAEKVISKWSLSDEGLPTMRLVGHGGCEHAHCLPLSE